MDSSLSDSEKSSELDQSGHQTDSAEADREEGPEKKRVKLDPDVSKDSDIETDPLAKLLESPDSASEKSRSVSHYACDQRLFADP